MTVFVPDGSCKYGRARGGSTEGRRCCTYAQGGGDLKCFYHKWQALLLLQLVFLAGELESGNVISRVIVKSRGATQHFVLSVSV